MLSRHLNEARLLLAGTRRLPLQAEEEEAESFFISSAVISSFSTQDNFQIIADGTKLPLAVKAVSYHSIPAYENMQKEHGLLLRPAERSEAGWMIL